MGRLGRICDVGDAERSFSQCLMKSTRVHQPLCTEFLESKCNIEVESMSESDERMTDNELLLALSDMIDTKLDAKIEPLKVDIYEKAVPQIVTIQSDVELLKRVVVEHSKKLQKIS